MEKQATILMFCIALVACYAVPPGVQPPPDDITWLTPEREAERPPSSPMPSPTPTPVVTPAPTPTPTPDRGSVLEGQELYIIDQVNKERQKIGISALTDDPILTELARDRSRDMAMRNYFSHTNPDGKTVFNLLKEIGYTYSTAGENIAMSTNPNDISIGAEFMNGWMKSSGHRANILNSKYTRLGVGIYRGANGKVYGTQVFATPR